MTATSTSSTSPQSDNTGPFWAWVGAHGGAGTSTLAAAVPGGVDLGQLLPRDAGHPSGLPVVAVCRSTARGLVAPRAIAARAAETRTPLLGLVVVADIPEKKRPKPLIDLLYITKGAFGGQVWEIPWVSAWRLGDNPTPANNPPEIPQLLRALWTATGLPLPQQPARSHNQ